MGEPEIADVCAYCDKPIDASGSNWHGIGSPHMPMVAHITCDPEDLKARIDTLKTSLYEAEAVCWAKYRIEKVGDRSVDQDADLRQYAEAWTRWKSRLEELPTPET